MSGLLKGRKNLNDHLKTLIGNAEKSVVLVTTADGLSRKGDVLKSALRKANERGVSIKIAAPTTAGVPKELSKVADVRHFDAAKARFAIIDGKEVLFMTSDDKDVHEAYDSAIWINSPFFAKSFEQMFENTWSGLKKQE